MSVEGHFNGIGDVKIHTSKSGTCSKANCRYQDNTATDGIQSKEWEGWQAHHVVCVQAVIRYQDPKLYAETQRSVIDDVYKGTEWCINQSPNMQWMPGKTTYIMNGVIDPEAPDDTFKGAWKLNLPCHEWDHISKGGYFDEMLQALQLRIWDKIKAVKQSKKKRHFGPKEAEAALSRLSEDYKGILKDRGARKGGTARAISEQKTLALWWLPFSMAKRKIAASRIWYVWHPGKRPLGGRRKSAGKQSRGS